LNRSPNHSLCQVQAAAVIVSDLGDDDRRLVQEGHF
jgi:hypothetical protein